MPQVVNLGETLPRLTPYAERSHQGVILRDQGRGSTFADCLKIG